MVATTKELSKKIIQHLTERRDGAARDKPLHGAEAAHQPHLNHFFRIASYRKRQILERILLD